MECAMNQYHGTMDELLVTLMQFQSTEITDENLFSMLTLFKQLDVVAVTKCMATL